MKTKSANLLPFSLNLAHQVNKESKKPTLDHKYTKKNTYQSIHTASAELKKQNHIIYRNKIHVYFIPIKRMILSVSQSKTALNTFSPHKQTNKYTRNSSDINKAKTNSYLQLFKTYYGDYYYIEMMITNAKIKRMNRKLSEKFSKNDLVHGL